MKKYIIKDSDGSISIAIGQLRLSEGQTLHKEESLNYPIPTDKRFRNAWVIKDGQVKVDLPKARQIKKAELLVERDERLVTGATAFALAFSLAQDTSVILSSQQALNDLETNITSDLNKKKKVETIDAYNPFTLYEL